jgi:hypothetical protein
MRGPFFKFCPNNAKVERDGKPYCGIHDPERLAGVRRLAKRRWYMKRGLPVPE